MRPIKRVGIVGCGSIANAHVAAARQVPGAQLVAVADIAPERANAFASRHEVPAAYASAEEMLARERLDVVIVATWPDSHATYVRLAASAGVRGVLVEKPLGQTLAEVEGMVATAEEAGVTLVEGLMYRHHPQMALARRLIAEGAIGRPILVRATFHGINDDPRNWRLQAAAGGGVIADRACYCVDSAQALLGGEPTDVAADLVVGARSSVVESMLAILFFGPEVRAILDASFLIDSEHAITVAGSQGRLVLPRPYMMRGCECGVVVIRPTRGHPFGEGEQRVEQFPPVDPYALELADLCDSLETGKRPLVTTADSIAVRRTMDAIGRGRMIHAP